MPGGWWLKYSPEFRAQALERLKTCDSVSGLARELKISRKWLYLWRERARATEDAQTDEDREKERLRKRVTDLEQLVGRQTAEIDFFRVPCEESRSDARATSGLAERHLRTNPGDAIARHFEHRANVPGQWCQPGRILPRLGAEGS